MDDVFDDEQLINMNIVGQCRLYLDRIHIWRDTELCLDIHECIERDEIIEFEDDLMPLCSTVELADCEI